MSTFVTQEVTNKACLVALVTDWSHFGEASVSVGGLQSHGEWLWFSSAPAKALNLGFPS